LGQIVLLRLEWRLRTFLRGWDARYDSPADPFGSRCKKGRRASVEGCTGRAHVVDEQNISSPNALRIGDDERTGHVGIARIAIEVGLAGGVSCAQEDAGPKGHTQTPSYRSGDEGRLIESPLGKARRVQGHRDDGEAAQLSMAWFDGAPKQVRQRPGQVGTPLVLHSPDCASNRPAIDETRDL
jgi:hypothetical protein